MKNTILIYSLLLAFLGSFAWAGDLDRVGTTSGSQLLIPIGARSISLGGASLGNISGAEAIYWNPSGLSSMQNSEFLFNRMTYIADIDVNYFAAAFNGGSIGSFGFHISSLAFGDIEITTEDQPDGNGDTYSPSFFVAGLTYSRLLTDRISAGVTGKYVFEGIEQTSAAAVALDLGVQYAFNNNLRLGVVMRNVGSKMTYDGSNLEQPFTLGSTNINTDTDFFKPTAISSDIPSSFGFGISYNVNVNEENGFIVNAAFTNYNDASDQIFGGVEYDFRKFFYLRGGYNYEAQVDANDQIFGGSFGAGISYPLGSFHFTLDYAFRQLTDYFDSNNVFTIKLAY